MTTKDAPLCTAYDQIVCRKCRYYTGHGGGHHFARLDHDSSLERELRRQVDEMTAARNRAILARSHLSALKRELRRELDEMTKNFVEALDLFDANWCTEHGHAPKPETFKRAAELGKKLGREPNYP